MTLLKVVARTVLSHASATPKAIAATVEKRDGNRQIRCRNVALAVNLTEVKKVPSLPTRKQFYGLVQLLERCPEPYLVASAIFREELAIVDELRQEMEQLVNDMVTLARIRKFNLSESDVAALREDLRNMGSLRQRYDLDLLFSAETRNRCGRCGVPILAAALCQVSSWAEYASEWLEVSDWMRIQVDAMLNSQMSGIAIGTNLKTSININAELTLE